MSEEVPPDLELHAARGLTVLYVRWEYQNTDEVRRSLYCPDCFARDGTKVPLQGHCWSSSRNGGLYRRLIRLTERPMFVIFWIYRCPVCAVASSASLSSSSSASSASSSSSSSMVASTSSMPSTLVSPSEYKPTNAQKHARFPAHHQAHERKWKQSQAALSPPRSPMSGLLHDV